MESKDRIHDVLVGIGQTLGRTRLVVLIAVAAVLLVSLSLFLLGAAQALVSVYNAWRELFAGDLESTDLTVRFLEIVSVMLKAVVFHLIGIGLFSLFVAPLNLAVALGIQTLYDLETKVVSVVIVILAVTFLTHFIEWKDSLVLLHHGIALAVAVLSLVVFQLYSHKAREDQQSHHPDVQARSKREMF